MAQEEQALDALGNNGTSEKITVKCVNEQTNISVPLVFIHPKFCESGKNQYFSFCKFGLMLIGLYGNFLVL